MKIRVAVAIETAVAEYRSSKSFENGIRSKIIQNRYRLRRYAAEGAIQFLSKEFPTHPLWRRMGNFSLQI